MSSFVTHPPLTPRPSLTSTTLLPSVQPAATPRLARHTRRHSAPLHAPSVSPRCAAPQPEPKPDFDPSTDPDFTEVTPFSFGPVRRDDAIITLRPTSGGPTAFRMSITPSQLYAIRTTLTPRRGHGIITSSSSASTAAAAAAAAAASSSSHAFVPERPSTHDLLHAMLNATSAFVTQAAITHIHEDVFVARVWLRSPTGLTHLDARPSDAIALALRARAPLYLRRGLLSAWGAPISALRGDSSVEFVPSDTETKSARFLQEEARRRPTMFALAVLRMRLDVAVRLERFGEASRLQERIREICPIDELEREVKVALSEERFLDAAKLRDEIVAWRARLRRWEKEGGRMGWRDGDGEEKGKEKEREMDM